MNQPVIQVRIADLIPRVPGDLQDRRGHVQVERDHVVDLDRIIGVGPDARAGHRERHADRLFVGRAFLKLAVLSPHRAVVGGEEKDRVIAQLRIRGRLDLSYEGVNDAQGSQLVAECALERTVIAIIFRIFFPVAGAAVARAVLRVTALSPVTVQQGLFTGDLFGECIGIPLHPGGFISNILPKHFHIGEIIPLPIAAAGIVVVLEGFDPRVFVAAILRAELRRPVRRRHGQHHEERLILRVGKILQYSYGKQLLEFWKVGPISQGFIGFEWKLIFE
ncbi:MAG: hypothetical protein FLDDKLPJ_02603 [Phycisphaerae bacterium]|nr:hypothetical protein [Phycisphaerae bacterium]